MRDSTGISTANPMVLKVVLGFGGLFVLVLLGSRLVGLAAFVQAIWARVPWVRVEPGILGDFVLLAAIVLVPLLFLLPRAWRVGAAAVLVVGALVATGISGSLTARGGPNISHTPLVHLLQSRGYVRCPARDRIRGSGRATRGEYVAEGWAQPGFCPGFAAPSADARQAGRQF